ncbi:Lar family restriction alleviation protein [Vibrio splendidus]|nr:Lar family restriction alleviation protein [Vibrio splendidus]MCC4880515.1 Lar family restriction alleviation protein [Vibrio splendidus]
MKRDNCPFCDENESMVQLGLEIEQGMFAAAVLCRMCDGQGAISSEYDTEEDAINDAVKKWNKRANEWNSVAHELPVKSGEYLCFIENGLIAKARQGVVTYTADETKKFGVDGVTYWKRLSNNPI